MGYQPGVRFDPSSPVWPVWCIDLPLVGEVSWHSPDYKKPKKSILVCTNSVNSCSEKRNISFISKLILYTVLENHCILMEFQPLSLYWQRRSTHDIYYRMNGTFYDAKTITVASVQPNPSHLIMIMNMQDTTWSSKPVFIVTEQYVAVLESNDRALIFRVCCDHNGNTYDHRRSSGAVSSIVRFKISISSTMLPFDSRIWNILINLIESHQSLDTNTFDENEIGTVEAYRIRMIRDQVPGVTEEQAIAAYNRANQNLVAAIVSLTASRRTQDAIQRELETERDELLERRSRLELQIQRGRDELLERQSLSELQIQRDRQRLMHEQEARMTHHNLERRQQAELQREQEISERTERQRVMYEEETLVGRHNTESDETQAASYRALLAHLYGLPVELPSHLIINQLRVEFISVERAKKAVIEKIVLDPMYQPWAGPPGATNRILLLVLKNGTLALTKARYDADTKEISSPK